MKNRSKNIIRRLVKENGTNLSEEHEIVNVFNFQFHCNPKTTRAEELIEVIPKVITDQDLKDLAKPVSLQEVKKVVLSFGGYKYPRPNGFSPSFFQYF